MALGVIKKIVSRDFRWVPYRKYYCTENHSCFAALLPFKKAQRGIHFFLSSCLLYLKYSRHVPVVFGLFIENAPVQSSHIMWESNSAYGSYFLLGVRLGNFIEYHEDSDSTRSLLNTGMLLTGFRSRPVLGRLRFRESSTRSRLRLLVKENKSLDFLKLTTNCLKYVLTHVPVHLDLL